MAHNGFRTPVTNFEVIDRTDHPPHGISSVFIRQNCRINVIALRDWLDEADNNAEGYQMTGCYDIDLRHRYFFIGLNFWFFRMLDATFFRMRWGG